MINLLETIMKIDYVACEFEEFINYIKSLDEYDTTLIKDDNNKTGRTIEYQVGDEFFKIIILKDSKKEWISFYRYDKNKVNYEEIAFLIFTNENIKEDGIEYNRVIRYSAHFDDDKYSKIITSASTYLDNKYICGWRQKRKISIEDLSKIFIDNRAISELPSRAEEKMLDFYEAIDLKEGEVKHLVLGYDE